MVGQVSKRSESLTHYPQNITIINPKQIAMEKESSIEIFSIYLLKFIFALEFMFSKIYASSHFHFAQPAELGGFSSKS